MTCLGKHLRHFHLKKTLTYPPQQTTADSIDGFCQPSFASWWIKLYS